MAGLKEMVCTIVKTLCHEAIDRAAVNLRLKRKYRMAARCRTCVLKADRRTRIGNYR